MSSSRDQSPSASGVGVGPHTPGPWMARSDHSVKSLAPGHWAVSGPCTGRRREANARLIAAAPDLLQALIVAVDGWEDAAQYKGEFLRDKHGDLEGIALARAAIAKALTLSVGSGNSARNPPGYDASTGASDGVCKSERGDA